MLAASLASPVLGQNVTASVTGTVTDNTGAVISSASIAAVNQRTGVEYPAKSNDAGRLHHHGAARSGATSFRAEAPGFKKLATNRVTLDVGQTARVNLKLEIGAVTEQVEVVGVNPILQTENAVVGEVITGSTVAALPLNGRNFAQLTLLTPGVQTHEPDTFTNAEAERSTRAART